MISSLVILSFLLSPAGNGLVSLSQADGESPLSRTSRTGFLLDPDASHVVIRWKGARCESPVSGLISLRPSGSHQVAALGFYATSAAPRSLHEFLYPRQIACGSEAALAIDTRLELPGLQVAADGTLVIPEGSVRVFVPQRLGGSINPLVPLQSDTLIVGRVVQTTGEIRLSGTLALGADRSMAFDLRGLDRARLQVPMPRAVVRRAGALLVLDGSASTQPTVPGQPPLRLTHFFWEYQSLDEATGKKLELGDGNRLTVPPRATPGRYLLTVVNEAGEHASIAVTPIR